MNLFIIIILTIIVIIIFGYGFNRFARLLEVKRLTKEETPEAWLNHLENLQSYKELSEAQNRKFWFFVKKTLSLTDLNSSSDGHIAIELRLKTLLFFYLKSQNDQNITKWLHSLRDIRIILDGEDESEVKKPYIVLLRENIIIHK